MHIVSHHSIDQLKQLVKRHRSSHIGQRLQIVLLGKLGKTFTEVAQESGFARSSCIEWIGRYNKYSLNGLENRRAPGKPKALNQEEEVRFRSHIIQGPKLEDKICAFHGSDVQKILKEEFGKERSLGAVYNLLHALGFLAYTLDLNIQRET